MHSECGFSFGQNAALAIEQQGELKGLIPLEDIWVLII